MIKAFKNFWKGYFNVIKESGRFMKKHWIGYIIFYIVMFFVGFGITLVNMKWRCDREIAAQNVFEHDTLQRD